MKKIILIAAVAFVLSAGAGTGIKIAITPGPADRAEAGEVHEDAAAVAPAHPAPGTPRDGHAGRLDAAMTEHASGAADPGSSRPQAGTTGSEGGLEFAEVGRILSAMSPDQASTFLGKLDDDLVARILGSMSVREAVRIVDCLPAERGNELWSRVMTNEGGRP